MNYLKQDEKRRKQLLEVAIKEALVRDDSNFETTETIYRHICNHCFAHISTQYYDIQLAQLGKIITSLGFRNAVKNNLRGYNVRLINRIDYTKPIEEQPTDHLHFPTNDSSVETMNFYKMRTQEERDNLGNACVFKGLLINRTIPEELMKPYSIEYAERWKKSFK